MKNMTQHMLDTYKVTDLNQALADGYQASKKGDTKFITKARDIVSEVRTAYGLTATSPALLTRPESNYKLAKAKKPSYGLTLHHYVFKSRLGNKTTFNLCPNAGDCTKVCVIENGHGNRDSTQLAWRWRTDLMAHHGLEFMNLLGWELNKAVNKHGKLLFRPNINSDIQWERVVPALVDGSISGKKIMYYGYTKLTNYLDGDGWLTPQYRVAYSFNEKTVATGIMPYVLDHLDNGGSVAVVTNRKRNSPIKQWDPAFKVVNADLTDEWMFKEGVVGDLSAKGRATRLIGKSNFVSQVY